MSCAQLSITGPDAGLVKPATVTFPGAYHSSDPGIVTSIFGITSYTVPGALGVINSTPAVLTFVVGPAVFAC
jgi:hypothetical protein